MLMLTTIAVMMATIVTTMAITANLLTSRQLLMIVGMRDGVNIVKDDDDSNDGSLSFSNIHHQHHHNFYLGKLQGSEFLAHSKKMQKIMSTAGCRSCSRMQIAAVELLAHSKRMHNRMSTAGCRSSSRMQIAAVS